MKKSYSRVLSIKPVGTSKVYDFTVKDTHRILANNFYTSNCHVDHPDIKQFIMKKDDLSKVTGANVSVKVTNEFMKAVENDADHILRWPVEDSRTVVLDQIVYNKLYKRDDGSYIMKVKAREIWDMIIRQAHKNAEPGVLFWDNIIKESPSDCYHDVGFKTLGTNPCVTGDTLIKTSKGDLTIPDIIRQYKNKDIRVLSFNESTKKLEYKEIEMAQKTKQNAHIIEIETDNGNILKLTPDHKVYTENRGWIEASKLEETDILLTI